MAKEIKRKTDWDAADLALQYDERAKKVLGYKTVLAFIDGVQGKMRKGHHGAYRG